MTPTLTIKILLVQALRLLHHRLAKRHIRIAVISGGLLCIPLGAPPPALLIGAHLLMAGVQFVGSIGIKRLSPDWPPEGRAT